MLGVSELALFEEHPKGLRSRSLNHRERADPLPSSSLASNISTGKIRRFAVMLSDSLVFCILLYIQTCM